MGHQPIRATGDVGTNDPYLILFCSGNIDLPCLVDQLQASSAGREPIVSRNKKHSGALSSHLLHQFRTVGIVADDDPEHQFSNSRNRRLTAGGIHRSIDRWTLFSIDVVHGFSFGSDGLSPLSYGGHPLRDPFTCHLH